MLKVNIQTNGPMFLSHIGPWKHQSEHSILYWTVLAQAKKIGPTLSECQLKHTV